MYGRYALSSQRLLAQQKRHILGMPPAAYIVTTFLGFFLLLAVPAGILWCLLALGYASLVESSFMVALAQTGNCMCFVLLLPVCFSYGLTEHDYDERLRI